MSKQSHGLDHILGSRLVTTLPITPRRKTKEELRRMAPEDRLLYERLNPKSEAEKLAELEREDRDHFYEMSGEVDHQDLLDNHPPADWGR